MSSQPELASEPWVAVLLDWQNIYNCARDAFGFHNSGSIPGNVDPLKLARHLASTSDRGRLQEVRIYRGRPDNSKDSRGYSAWRSQTAAWKQSGGALVIERYRDLRYRGQEIVEKGIDVWLAVDLVRIAMEQSADRVVVVSSDTDIVPALELAVELRGDSFVEVAGWVGSEPSAALLDVRGVSKRALNPTLYQRFADPSDYNLPARARRKTGWDAQIEAEGRKRRP